MMVLVYALESVSEESLRSNCRAVSSSSRDLTTLACKTHQQRMLYLPAMMTLPCLHPVSPGPGRLLQSAADPRVLRLRSPLFRHTSSNSTVLGPCKYQQAQLQRKQRPQQRHGACQRDP